MSKIKSELKTLKEVDTCSLSMFSLYKMKDIPEYATLSELAYLLGIDSLLKLCEYFGGETIKLPEIEEVETSIQALLLYQYTTVDGMSYDDALKLVNTCKTKTLRTYYTHICDVMNTYTFTPRG